MRTADQHTPLLRLEKGGKPDSDNGAGVSAGSCCCCWRCSCAGDSSEVNSSAVRRRGEASAAGKEDGCCGCGLPLYAQTYHKQHEKMESGWRSVLLSWIHSVVVQDFILVLLVLDILCVVSEMVIETYKREGNEVVPERVEEVLEYLGLSILVTFMLEIFIYMLAKGFSFFCEPLEVLDLFVVSGSLYQDLHYHHAEGKLLMLLRMWRFGRIFHGVWTAEHERCEREISRMEEELEELQQHHAHLLRLANMPLIYIESEAQSQTDAKELGKQLSDLRQRYSQITGYINQHLTKEAGESRRLKKAQERKTKTGDKMHANASLRLFRMSPESSYPCVASRLQPDVRSARGEDLGLNGSIILVSLQTQNLTAADGNTYLKLAQKPGWVFVYDYSDATFKANRSKRLLEELEVEEHAPPPPYEALLYKDHTEGKYELKAFKDVVLVLAASAGLCEVALPGTKTLTKIWIPASHLASIKCVDD